VIKRVLIVGAILAAAVAFLVVAGGASNSNSGETFKIQLDNAFGLVPGADFKVAGVKAGKIEKLDLPTSCKKGDGNHSCYAEVTVSVTQTGFGQFHSDAFCQTRPQSLIGEYFIDCQPGTKGKPLKSGSLIPVTHTQSTIPVDLVNDIMRLPYRQRLSLIINELGAATAGRSGDLQAALRRAVPALTQTDNLLNLLSSDSSNIQNLTVNSDKVITELANNSKVLQKFIDEANRTATISATQQHNIALGLQRLPGFLEQLRPSMRQLGAATDANLPAIRNLNASAGQLTRLFRDLPSFAHAALPATRALGKASVPGRQAAVAATPTIRYLNQFAKPTPELAQNLTIVLHDLDNRNRAVEPDARSPQGRGYTGLEALLQYAFNQALAINTFNPLGHLLAVDLFVDPLCSPYASPQTVAQNLAAYGSQARRCYAWLGPNQPGINETDPSNPSGCVPDPGGAPDGERGPATSACKEQANPTQPASLPLARDKGAKSTATSTPAHAATASASSSGGGSSGSSGSSTGSSGSSGSSGSGTASAQGATSSAGQSGAQTQQLLNYLLAP
jgi:ABC-type transporter Mla subunit MlaD